MLWISGLFFVMGVIYGIKIKIWKLIREFRKCTDSIVWVEKIIIVQKERDRIEEICNRVNHAMDYSSDGSSSYISRWTDRIGS